MAVGQDGPPASWWHRADWGALLVVLVVLASSATSLGNGFAYDDVPIVRDNDAVHAWRWPWEFLGETYWMPPYGQALWRPITIGLFSVQWMAGGGSPLSFHIVNVVAYAVAALLLLRLARGFMHPSIALSVAALWAAHPVHVEVVGNVIGQSELWVALSALVALSTVERVREDGCVTGRRALVILTCVVLGLGSKENGVVLPVLVGGILAGWLLGSGAVDIQRRRGWMVVRACVYSLVVYLGARYAVLGTLGGDGSHLAIGMLTTGERVLAALALRVTEARLLLLGGPLAADYGPPTHPLHSRPDTVHAVALALVGAWGAAIWWFRGAGVRVWPLLWVPLALAPAANLLFPTGIVMAERSLFVPSIGILLSIGVLVDRLFPHVARRVGAPVRQAALATTALVVVAAALASARRQPVWQDTHTLVATSLVDAPRSPTWQRVLATVFLRAGEFDRAEVHFRLAEALGPPDLRLLNGMRILLERQGRCDEALLYYRRMLAAYQRTPAVEMGYVACLLRVGHLADARLVAMGARVTAPDPAPFDLLRQLAESALVAHDSVRLTNLWWRQGRPAAPTAIPLAIHVDDRGALIRSDLPAVEDERRPR
jgi:protein O-mannosyl-transferase